MGRGRGDASRIHRFLTISATTHPGRVWLDKRLADDERAEVACLFVGLMLYQPKQEEP